MTTKQCDATEFISQVPTVLNTHSGFSCALSGHCHNRVTPSGRQPEKSVQISFLHTSHCLLPTHTLAQYTSTHKHTTCQQCHHTPHRIPSSRRLFASMAGGLATIHCSTSWLKIHLLLQSKHKTSLITRVGHPALALLEEWGCLQVAAAG